MLIRLESAGLTVKLSKSKFAMQSVEYFRHKIEAVRSFPTPDTKTAVRTFLGITGYYRRFIPDFASVAAPLTDLTKKSAPNIVLWSLECFVTGGILKDVRRTKKRSIRRKARIRLFYRMAS